jgi:hypothetical protein
MANNNNAAPPLVPENEDAYANTPRTPDPEFVGHEVAIERVVNDGPLRITFRGRAYALNMPELRGASAAPRRRGATTGASCTTTAAGPCSTVSARRMCGARSIRGCTGTWAPGSLTRKRHARVRFC